MLFCWSSALQWKAILFHRIHIHIQSNLHKHTHKYKRIERNMQILKHISWRDLSGKRCVRIYSECGECMLMRGKSEPDHRAEVKGLTLLVICYSLKSKVIDWKHNLLHKSHKGVVAKQYTDKTLTYPLSVHSMLP